MRTIAYLGPEATYTHQAAQAKFGRRSQYVHAPTVEDIFRMVEREQADMGVVPIENSLEGAVTHTLDRFVAFKQSPIRICGEIEQPIRHALILQKKGTPLSDLTMVFSHPQAFAQCRRWLETHLRPYVMRYETSSTAEAVRYLLAKGPFKTVALRERAAIGRADLARAHGLRAVPITDARQNRTRFLIIGLQAPARGRRNKTAILVTLKDRPGALYHALAPFKRERINMTKIESRPSQKKAWEYYFFIDFEGHETDARVRRALKALSTSTTLLRVLGSYPVRG